MGKLNPTQNTTITAAPVPLGRLASRGTPQTQGEKSVLDRQENLRNTFIGIPVSEYKDYTPFDTGNVYINQAMDDSRAINQGWGEQLWNGLFVRGLGTTGTKFMSGLGYVGGFFGYAATGFQDISEMTDNSFSAYWDGLEQDIKEFAPIYKPSWVQNGGFWDQAKSLSFWMDEGVDGAAFLASALIPGGIIGKGLKLGTRIASIIGKGAKAAKIIDDVAVIGFQTISEAAVEAHGTQNRVRQELQSKVDQGLMTSEEVELKAAEAARNDFLLNGLILIGPNIIQNKLFFGNAAKAAERNVLNKIVDDAGNIIDAGPITKNLVSKSLLKKGGISIVSESMEENAQLAVENATVDIATGKSKDNLFTESVGNVFENFGTTEGQISMFLGGVLGVLGGAVGGYKQGKAEKAAILNAQQRLESYNNTYTANFKQLLNSIYLTETVDGKEQLKKDEKGNLIVDLTKIEGVTEKLNQLRDIEAGKQVALLQKDYNTFEELQNISFANLAVEHLQYGEGSLEVLNKRIDRIAEENKKEYEEIFGALGIEDTQSIDRVKEQQKKIAKRIYDTLEKQKDFSGVWSVNENQPKFKDKNELKTFDSFVQESIGRKAITDAQIDWLGDKIESVDSKKNVASNELSQLENNKSVYKEGLERAKQELKNHDKNNDELTEDEKNVKRARSKSKVQENIEEYENQLEEIDEKINEKAEEFSRLKEVSEGYKEKRKSLKNKYGDKSNKTLQKEIIKDWESAKKQAEKIKEQVAKEEKIKSKQQDKVENKDSNTQATTDKTIESLEKELVTLRNELAQAKTIEEFGEIEDEDQTSEAIAKKIRDIQNKIDSMKTGTPANQIKNQEIPPVQESEETPNTIVSEAMTSNTKLNPEKQGSFNNATIVKNLGNQVLTSQERNTENVGNRSNVVMHTQLESIVIKIKDGTGTIKGRIFYFNSDPKGNPINSNTSGVDFDYVNNSTSLDSGKTVEYKKVALNEEQKESIQKSIDKSINELKALIKRGEKIDESNNYGFGSVEDAIGIFSEDKLIGFVQLPHAYSLDSEDSLSQKATRDSILAERSTILEKLNKGEKVTTTIVTKGKGNYFSKHKDNKAVTTNEDGTQIRPEVREIDKFEGKSLFAYFNLTENKWVIPYGKSNKKVEKELEVISKYLNDSGFTGFNGQMVMLVRSANGSYSPIPVFTTKLNESDANSVWDILVQNRNFEPKDVITALNPFVFASIGLKSNFRVYPESDKVYLEIDGQKFDLKDIQSNEAKIKPLIRELRKNIVATEINNKEYQDNMLKNDLTTNVITINGQYFIQPYIQLESIISEEKKTKIKPKIGVEPKVESKTTTTTFQANIPFETKQIKVAIKGKRTNFTLTNEGKVLDSNNTEVTDNQIINSVLEQEAKDSDNFVALTYDGKKVKALAALTKSDIGLTRSFKLVYLDGQEVSVDDAIEILKNNPEVDLLKKQCK